MLEEPDRHLDGAGAVAAEDIRLREHFGQLVAHRLAHLLVVAQPVAGAPREQVVPVLLARRAAGECRGMFLHGGWTVAGAYSWDSSVVT